MVRRGPKEAVLQIYDRTDPDLAVDWAAESRRDFHRPEMPIEVHQLGRTIIGWADQITAWHRSQVGSSRAPPANGGE